MLTPGNVRLSGRGLYAVADTRVIRPLKIAAAAAAAIEGGAKLIQYRDKGRDRVRRWREARQLLRLCRDAGVGFIINDDVDLAAALDADGVHIGRDDATLADVKARLTPDAIVGVSCYDSLACAEQAQADGAGYVAFGSFYPSPTKPDAVRAPIGLLRAARRRIRVPIVAIGGITPNNGAPLVDAGADYLAAISGVFASRDIVAAAQQYTALFTA